MLLQVVDFLRIQNNFFDQTSHLKNIYTYIIGLQKKCRNIDYINLKTTSISYRLFEFEIFFKILVFFFTININIFLKGENRKPTFLNKIIGCLYTLIFSVNQETYAQIFILQMIKVQQYHFLTVHHSLKNKRTDALTGKYAGIYRRNCIRKSTTIQMHFSWKSFRHLCVIIRTRVL